MKRIIIVALVLSIVGCDDSNGDSDESCGPSYSYPNEVYGNTGIILRAPNHAVTFIPFEEMEQIYDSVEMCVVNVNTPGPIIEFRSFDHMGLGGAWGVYAANGTAYINTDEHTVERNCHSDRAVLKHEFVHHILYMNGRDWKHTNPAFVQCEALGPAVCDGVACQPTD